MRSPFARDEPGGELVPFPSRPVEDVDDGENLPAVIDAELEELPTPPSRRGQVQREPIDVVVRRTADYRPVLPGWAKSFTELRRACRWWGLFVGHRAGFHGVRLPVYAARAAAFAPFGGLRLIRTVGRWAFDAEAAELRWATVASKDHAAYMRLSKQRNDRVRQRLTVTGLAALGVLIVVLVAAVVLSAVLLAVAIVACVVVFGYVGRPRGRAFLFTAADNCGPVRLTDEVVVRAFVAARLCKPDDPIGLATPCHRDAEGWRVVLDLPYGKGFSDAVDRREALASGLDVAVSQVFLSRDAASHRRLTLWVADTDPLAAPAGRTPLLRCKPTDIWSAAPFGVDERGDRVFLELMWNSLLVGAQPRKGKTFTARQLALFAALDPYVRLSVFDGKGSPDWRGFTRVADRCSFGLGMTRDGDPVEIFLDALRAIKADVQDRNQRLSDLPTDICPEGKLTREIARDPAYNMPVHLVVIDEFQEYFDTPDADVNKEIAGLLVFLVKVAPSVGVILLGATQKPGGIGGGRAGELFTAFRDNFIVRFALRTGSWSNSDLVLGSGAYSEGHDSSLLLPSYKGVGILRGATDHTPTVRTYLADAQDAEKILDAARALRSDAGTLTGYAAGDKGVREVRDVLADVRGVFAGEPGLHWEQIAARLADQVPEHYADVTADTVSAQLRGLGVSSVDVKREGLTRKGARATEIARAVDRRGSAGG